MKLAELTEEIERTERLVAPGGKTQLWGDYCERMRQVTGCLPYEDRETDPDVPTEEAEWWLAAYKLIEEDDSLSVEDIVARLG